MATSSQLDPVQGLIDYVLEIKPYHTKIVEVLIEHIHVDCVDVTFVEGLNFCVNIGFPNLNSKFMFEIVEIDVGTKTFKVNGDARFSIIPGQRVQVVKSVQNSGYYTVQDVTYDTGIDVSSIIMTTAPFSSSIAGTGHGDLSFIVDNTIVFCPDGLDYPFVKQLEPTICTGEGFGASYYDGVVFEIISSTSSTISISGDKVDEFAGITDVQIVDSVGTVVGSFAVLSVTLNGSQTDIDVTPSVPALSGTNYLFVRNIPYDTDPYTCGSPSTASIMLARTTFTETIEFGWANVVDWFQSPIIAVDGILDTFTVAGNLSSILQVGEEFEITGSPSGLNDGTWTAGSVTFDGTNTVIGVTTTVGTTTAGGYARSINVPGETIALFDSIGTTVNEDANAGVATTSGSFIGSWDYDFWDITGFDEDLGTLINLYSN